MLTIVTKLMDLSVNPSFVTWHCCRELAHQVPEMDSSKDIARMVMCMPPSRCYFFDLPKSVTKGNMMAMYKAIEKSKTVIVTMNVTNSSVVTLTVPMSGSSATPHQISLPCQKTDGSFGR